MHMPKVFRMNLEAKPTLTDDQLALKLTEMVQRDPELSATTAFYEIRKTHQIGEKRARKIWWEVVGRMQNGAAGSPTGPDDWDW